jgi:hypothetical protein
MSVTGLVTVHRQFSIIWEQINRAPPSANYDVLQRICTHLWTDFNFLLFCDSSMLGWVYC